MSNTMSFGVVERPCDELVLEFDKTSNRYTSIDELAMNKVQFINEFLRK